MSFFTSQGSIFCETEGFHFIAFRQLFDLVAPDRQSILQRRIRQRPEACHLRGQGRSCGHQDRLSGLKGKLGCLSQVTLSEVKLSSVRLC
jgi:hypothetical protein